MLHMYGISIQEGVAQPGPVVLQSVICGGAGWGQGVAKAKPGPIKYILCYVVVQCVAKVWARQNLKWPTEWPTT